MSDCWPQHNTDHCFLTPEQLKCARDHPEHPGKLPRAVSSLISIFPTPLFGVIITIFSPFSPFSLGSIRLVDVIFSKFWCSIFLNLTLFSCYTNIRTCLVTDVRPRQCPVVNWSFALGQLVLSLTYFFPEYWFKWVIIVLRFMYFVILSVFFFLRLFVITIHN